MSTAIQQTFSAMLALMLAKLVLNDVPHATGLYGHTSGRTLSSLFAAWGIDIGDQVKMYHFTREENVKSILASGLLPGTLTGVRKTSGSEITTGIYLAPSVEEAKNILEDYSIQEDRTPGVFSLLEVTLPSSWVVMEDPDVAHRYKEPPTVVSQRPIPPSKLRLLDEHFFTVEPVSHEYREAPGVYANIGDRVKVVHGEHAGEYGVVTSFADRLEDGFVVWKIILDSGVTIEDREDRVIPLFR